MRLSGAALFDFALLHLALAAWFSVCDTAPIIAEEPQSESAESAANGEAAESDAAESDAPNAKPLDTGNDQEPAAEDPLPAARRRKSSTLDEKLLKSLGVTPAGDSEQDPLQQAIQRMRSVQSRIGNKDAGAKTLSDQAQIVKDLEKLIEQIKQQQQAGAASDSRPRNAQPQPENGEATEQSQSQPQNSAQQKPGRRQQENPKAAESTDRTEPGRPVTAEEARREELEKDVWGHLPPALRKQLLNVYSDKFLPKYEDLVRRYYETLAERGRKGQR